MAITAPPPLPGSGDDRPSDYTKSPKFQALLREVRQKGTSKLNPADTISVQELFRQKELHHDPRVRASLSQAYSMIQKAHLEYCVRLSTKS